MKKIVFFFSVLSLLFSVSCQDSGIPPERTCIWSKTDVIKFSKVSLKYPEKTNEVDIEDEIQYFNDNGRVGEWEYDDNWDDEFWDHHYMKDQILRLSDVFKYGKAWIDRGSRSQIDVAIKATGNCSFSTESMSSTYKADDSNEFNYEAQYENYLNNQYRVRNFPKPEMNNENSATITVTFGPFKNKIDSKMGVIAWSKTIENTIYYPNKEHDFEATGTFKTIEMDIKSIYIGGKFVIREF